MWFTMGSRVSAVIRTFALSALLCIVAAPANAVVITEFPIATAASQPVGITAGADGALWFTEFGGNKIGRITTTGTVTEFSIPTTNSGPRGITLGGDGAFYFTESNQGKIGRITGAGSIMEFNLPAAGSGPRGIVAAPDGELWFTEINSGKIGEITTTGFLVGEFAVPTAASNPDGIAIGPDDALWFTQSNANKIGRINLAGGISEFVLPTFNSGPSGIVRGPDAALWFTEAVANKIGRITTAGAITEFPLPTPGSGPQGITVGPDGALWFTEMSGNRIGRITTAGAISEFPLPTANSQPVGITTGPDGALWFTESQGNRIGRLTVFDAPTVVAAVLPLSRSVQVGGNQATAFAVMLNAGGANAVNCAPAAPSNPPAGLGLFIYQTTTQSNVLTGTPNTPVDIAPGGFQHFAFGFSPTAPVAETSLAMRFLCDNAAPAAQTPGVNNLFIVADSAPVPDTIALIATISGDGVVRIPNGGGHGLQVFAVGSSNVGATGTIVVSADTGGVPLPVTLTVCETNSGGACMAAAAPTVTVNYAAGTNRSFEFFAQASGSIPFDPTNNRVFVRLTQSGVTRGATSAAICTSPNTGC